eukprot:scaffold117184_cov21-Tisochrysis_lutea.AAC.1
MLIAIAMTFTMAFLCASSFNLYQPLHPTFHNNSDSDMLMAYIIEHPAPPLMPHPCTQRHPSAHTAVTALPHPCTQGHPSTHTAMTVSHLERPACARPPAPPLMPRPCAHAVHVTPAMPLGRGPPHGALK